MKPVIVAPVFVTAQPIMRRLDELLPDFSRQIPLAAGELTGHWPPDATTASMLYDELQRRAEAGESDSDLWTVIACLARNGGAQGQTWQLVACGLAADSLREAARAVRADDASDRQDVQADLIEMFLTGLCKIDPSIPGIARILALSARRHAQRQQEARIKTFRKLKKPGRARYRPSLRLDGPRDIEEALQDLAARFTAAGQALDPVGVELIARTVLDGETLSKAAASLGLSTDAAYKRRQRTENRIAQSLHITARRRASGRLKKVSRASDRGRRLAGEAGT